MGNCPFRVKRVHGILDVSKKPTITKISTKQVALHVNLWQPKRHWRRMRIVEIFIGNDLYIFTWLWSVKHKNFQKLVDYSHLLRLLTYWNGMGVAVSQNVGFEF